MNKALRTQKKSQTAKQSSNKSKGIRKNIKFMGVCGARTIYVTLFDRTPLREINRYHGKDIFVMEGFMRSKQYRWFEDLFSKHEITNVGETGFNGGHSAFTFAKLGANTITSFDIGEHQYVKGAYKYLEGRFPNTKFSLILGDSQVTLPKFQPKNKFDIVFIDGGHDLETVTNDIKNMREHSKPGGLLVLDDYTERYTSRLGPKIAYDKAVRNGIITPLEVYSGDFRTWALGRFN